jgi:hypothetical protein
MDFDATAQVDQILANYEASGLIIWITVGVIIVAIIALGTEFWANLWGVIFSPSLTFQRILGEAQAVPGLVIVAVTGMACGAIVNSYLSNETVVTNLIQRMNNPTMAQVFASLDQIFSQVKSDFSLEGNMGYIQQYIFQAQTVAVAMPLVFLVIWLLWGLAAQLASMIAGNKAGHGITNIWSAIPYIFMYQILSNWFDMMKLAGNGAARILGYIVGIYMIFLHVVMMREHGRYSVSNAIVATILTAVLFVVLSIVAVVLVVFIAAEAALYL